MEANQYEPGEENGEAAVGTEPDLDDELDETAPPPIDVVIEESTGDEDDKVDLNEEASFSAEQRKQRWLARRPRIDHLKDGVIFPPGTSDALPLFDVGDRIVVDVSTVHLKGSPWLETLVGKVRTIDDDTGLVTLWDEDSDQRNPMTRYVSVREPLCIFKLAPAKGNPFDASKAARVVKVLAPGEVKRGRGRPPGSKNRPKEVIKAEREARKAASK